ncbi:MAG: Gfo/Idh/MocA family oxidoreductase [Anaerolineae bacterium]|nr:Gfo/Idh/MocA family oxidoreductase [Anaerolineae bacterium]
MSEPLRVGVIGAGIGAGYIAGFQRQPHVEVTALCTRTGTRSNAVAERYHIPNLYTDYETMLAQEPLDIVVVATPNNLHHPMTLAALHAGKHVLCDKPLALNAIQAREMLDCAEQAGRRHFVPFVWRFVPGAMYMKEIIDSGFVGQVYHVNVRYFNLGWGDIHGPMRWQWDKAQAGSGALSNIGSHAIHLLHWWFGDITRVCAMLNTAVKQRVSGDHLTAVDVDDHGAFLGELSNGAQVVFNASQVALVRRNFLQIDVFGSDGSLIFVDDWGEPDTATGRIYAMRRNDHALTQVTIPPRLTGEFLDMPDYFTPFRACFGRMTAAFVQAIRQDIPATPNFQDGVRVQEVLDAVLQSALDEKWITL